jgi:hypothetical protein
MHQDRSVLLCEGCIIILKVCGKVAVITCGLSSLTYASPVGSMFDSMNGSELI